MKKFRYIIVSFVAVFALSACTEEFYQVKDTKLSVTVPSTVVYAGESVNFALDGDVDFITFYSGEAGNDYKHSKKENARITYGCASTISFYTAYDNNGTQWKRQILAEHDSLRMLRAFVSTDFNGDYTLEGVNSATWTELTSQITWPASASSTYLVAGTTPNFAAKLFDFIPQGKDSTAFWFAFKYQVDAYDEEKKNERTLAAIHSFLIQNTDPNNLEHTQTKVDYSNAGWSFVTEGYKEKELEDELYAPMAGSYIWFNCYPCVPVVEGSEVYNTAARNCWAISNKLIINSQIDDGCDVGVGIKGASDPIMKEYQYTFLEPGEYDVHFIYRNTGSSLGGVTTFNEGETSIKIKVIERGSSTITDPDEKEW